jgi:hypothetical protein
MWKGRVVNPFSARGQSLPYIKEDIPSLTLGLAFGKYDVIFKYNKK